MFLLIFASLALVGLGLEYVFDDDTATDNNVEIENEDVTETWGRDISLSAEDIIASQTPDQVDVPVDTLDDTSGSDTGTVTVDVDPNTSIEMLATSDGMQAQYGTSGNDLMTGGASRDFLLGSDGNDTLEGGANDDFLFGGQGSDWIEGDAGDDVILTFPVYDEAAVWQDMQQGGSAWGALMHNFDTNYTVSGSDTVYAGQGDDAIFFANGDDIHGQGGHDTYHLVDVDGANPAYIHGYQNGEQIDIYTYDLGADMTVKTQGNDTVIALNNTPVLIVKGTEGNFNSSAVTLQYDLLV